MRLIVAVAMLAVCCVDAAGASMPSLRFRHWGTGDGLSNSTVTCFLRSRQGYLWVGTENGLNRCDGSRFKLYAAASGLGQICSLQEDADGDVWVESHGRYMRYDHAKDAIDSNASQHLGRLLGMDVSDDYAVFADRTGDLWVQTRKGMCRYSFKARKAGLLRTTGLESADFSELRMVDGGSHIVVAQQKPLKLWRLDKESARLTRIAVDEAVAVATVGKPCDVYADESGSLWVYALYGDDIYRLARGEAHWQRIDLRRFNAEAENSIRRITSDGKGQVWIATDKRGLFAYDLADGTIANIASNSDEATGLQSDNVNTVYCDAVGNVWVGYYKKGMSVASDAMSRCFQLRHNHFGDAIALMSEANGDVWVGTDGNGLWRTTAAGQTTHLLAGKTVTAISRDKRGRLWVGTFHNGLYCIDGGKTVNYNTANSELPDNMVVAIQIDRLGNMWIGSQNTHLAKMTCDEQGRLHGTASKYDIVALCFDYSGGDDLWVGTYYGVGRIDIASGKLNMFFGNKAGTQQFDTMLITALRFEPSTQRLWVGHSPSLSVLDLRCDRLYSISTDDGLCDRMVNDITVLGRNNMLVSTSKGLSRISVSDKDGRLHFNIENYTHSLGIDGKHFNSHASARLGNSNMLLGTPDGCVEVDCNMLLAQQGDSAARVRFTELMIGGQGIQPDSLCEGRVVIDRPIDQLDVLRLRHDERQITICFSLNKLISIADTRYAYRVEGLEREWQHTSESQLTLNSLEPGEYTLQVRLANDADGHSMATLRIVVAPPPYSTTAAYMLYALLAVSIAILSLLYIRSRRRRQNEVQPSTNAPVATVEVEPSEIAITSLDEQLLAKALEAVEQHIADQDFTVEELGRILGLSRTHLYKKLMSLTGKGPAELIRTIRVKRGRQLLDESGMQINEVAYAVGFSTPKRFSLNFKEEYGMLPSEYIKNHRNKS